MPDAAGRAHGVRIPGGLLPFAVAASVLAAAQLSRLRRRSRRSLDNPEPRRADGAIVRSIRQSGSAPATDALTPFTQALLAVYMANVRSLPRVTGAWDSGEAVQFLLDADAQSLPEDGVDDQTGIRVEFGARDGLAVAVATGERLASLSHEPIAVVGKDASYLVEAMLMAAALRVGGDDDLRVTVTVAGDLLRDIRPPRGVDLPPFERMAPADVAAALSNELERRPRVLQANSCDTFAELAAESPGYMPAWVLVLDAKTAAGCAAELSQLASLGVGALVVGDTSAAPRKLIWEDGGVCVTAPGLETFRDLVPFVLPEGLLEELEAEAIPEEGPEPLVVEESRAAEGAEDVPLVDRPEPTVRMYLLRGYRLVRAGVEVPLSATTSAQARELLAYLAVAANDDGVADGWIPATTLCEVLWPDEVDAAETQKQTLQSVVSKARRWAEGGDRRRLEVRSVGSVGAAHRVEPPGVPERHNAPVEEGQADDHDQGDPRCLWLIGAFQGLGNAFFALPPSRPKTPAETSAMSGRLQQVGRR